MRKLVGVLFAGMFLVGLARAVWADDDNNEGPNFTFGASTSYVYDFNDPKNDPKVVANHLSYANQETADESFNIDLVQLGINGSRGHASYGAKIDYGDLTSLAGDSADGDIGLQTAYLSYDFGGAGITAGRWDTPIGYEVLEPWGNANISRSYSWTLLQPINHDGIFVSGNAGIVDGMLGVANGFTVNEASTGFNDIDDEKAIIGAVGVAVSDALNLYGSGIYTEDGDIVDRQLYNAIVSGKVPMNGSGFRYAVEGNYRLDDRDEGPDPQGEAQQWSIVAYLGADFGPTSLDVRGEYLDVDTDGSGTPGSSFVLDLKPQDIPDDPATPGVNESDPSDFAGNVEDRVWNITVTAGWYLTDGLQFRLEYRHDAADDTLAFADGNNAEDSLDTLQAQVVWYPEL